MYDGAWTSVDMEKIKAYFNTLDEKITLGIDGYIDEVWEIVASRRNRDDYAVFGKVKDFAKAVYECGEGGYSNEIVRKRRSYGGFTANTGKAAGRLGGTLTMIGMFGTDAIDSVFQAFQDAYRVISVGPPAICHVYEFNDGKIMLPYIESVMHFDWATLKNAVPWDVLRGAFAEARTAALGYWSLMPAFDEILMGLYENCLANSRCGRLFFDLADIRKRDMRALDHTMETFRALNKKIPITLSLNEHEAALFFAHMGAGFTHDPSEVETILEHVRSAAALDELIVHTPYFSAAATASEGTAAVRQRYCENPVRTTGAGDNFNGGYMIAGLCAGALNIYERLFIGNAVTGFYVGHGYSPDANEAVAEMDAMRREA